MRNIALVFLLIIVTNNSNSSEFETSEIWKQDLKRFSRSNNEKNSTQLECREFTNCTSCVSSEHPCVWCIENRSCNDNSTPSCISDVLITGRSQQSYRSGPSYCPRIISYGGSNEILVPADTNKSIQARVKIDQINFLVQANFQCYFDLGNEQIIVNARLLADTIYCDSVEFQNSENKPNQTVTFNIIWGSWRTLDNPDNLHIVIYRCSALADTKEKCASLATKFQCSWCPASNSCETQDKCHENVDLKSKNCNAFDTCTPCVSANMSCNWCVDANRCVNHTDTKCHNDILVNGPNFCPRILSISHKDIVFIPAGTEKSISAKVQLVSEFLILTRFKCQFEIEDQLKIVDAQLLGDTIYCDSIQFQYSAEVSNVTAKLSIIWGNNKKLDNPNNKKVVIYRCNLLAYNAGLCSILPEKYNCAWCPASNSCELTTQNCQSNNTGIEKIPTCNDLFTCTSCVTSKLKCSWCIDSNRCIDNTIENCRNDILISSASLAAASYRSGPDFCQRITVPNGQKEILIPAGTQKIIQFKTVIISQFIIQTRFGCQFNIEGKIQQVPAQLLGDTIYCDVMEFQYTSQLPNITVPFAVIWGGSKPLDNPDNIEIVIYRCKEMGKNFEKCSKLPEKYYCSWCSKNSACELKNQCPLE